MSSENKKTELEVKEDEKHLLIDHSYDGLQELNHPLPGWWNFLFWFFIAVSGVYFVYYQLMSGPTLRDEFKVSYQKVLDAQAEFKKLNSGFNLDTYNAILADDGVNKGKQVFADNCQSCHNENGKGDIGPNLTDDHWLIAKGTPETVYQVAFNGSEENGMPAWGELLDKDDIYRAVAYVATLKNTFVKGGKAAQGEKIVEAEVGQK